MNLKEFEKLYKTYQPSLVNYANFFLKNEQDSIDTVQEFFISIWQKKDSFPETENIKSYLLKSIKNRCINKINRNPNLQNFTNLLHDITLNEASPIMKLEAKETELQIKKLVESLPFKCKEIFLLSRFEQLSYKEIAIQLDITVKTVENQIGNAIKLLRKHNYLLLTISILQNF